MERLLIERNGTFIWHPVSETEAEIARQQGKIVRSLRQLVPTSDVPKPMLYKSYTHQYLARIGEQDRWVDCGISYAANRAAEGHQVRFKQW